MGTDVDADIELMHAPDDLLMIMREKVDSSMERNETLNGAIDLV